jgi:hypothetical protein
VDLTKLVEDDDLPELPTITLGKYRHYKDKLYEVIGVAMHSETLEALVVYRPLYKKKVQLWVRPYAMFTETVEVDGKMKPRFEKVND